MRICAPVLAMALAACGDTETPPTPLTEAESAALSPTDPRVAELYEGSCKDCHTVKDAQAPLTGDLAAWNPRWAKGEDALLASAMGGIKGMPAGGQCFECTPEDLKALIRFMAGHEQ